MAKNIEVNEGMFDSVERFNKQMFKQIMRLKNKENSFNDEESSILGFYYTVLLGEHDIDISEVEDLIIDSDFCEKIHGERFDDLGVDAVNIDNESEIIYLYSFKHKDNFTQNSTISPKTLGDMKQFIDTFENLIQKSRMNSNKISNHDIKKYGEIVGNKLRDISYELMLEDKAYKIELVLVSNTSKKIKLNTDEVKSLESKGININQILLPEIYSKIISKPEISAKILIDNNSMLVYEETTTREITYIVPLKLKDIVRISCDNMDARMDSKYDFQGDELSFEYDVIDSNVRGFMKKSKFNDGIIQTLEKEPTKFFLYNNGITFVVDKMEQSDSNNFVRNEYDIKNLQVVNGGQTIRSIFNFISKREDWTEKLENAKVLAKFIPINNKKISSERIAQYTNSQNPIDNIDLKSIDEIQLNLEIFLREEDICYIRKVGDYNLDEDSYSNSISMVKLGQLLYSEMGYPHKASNARQTIFKDNYDKVFGQKDLYKKSLSLIGKYDEAKEEYDSNDKIKFSVQKSFYIIYILKNSKRGIKSSISLLEKTLEKFDNNGVELSNARKLLKTDFKELLDQELNKKSN